MGEEGRRTRRAWFTEDDGDGFDEYTPPGPVMSVTIIPKGRCYSVAKDIIARLAHVMGEGSFSQPHITLQGIYNNADLSSVQDSVADVADHSLPFSVNIMGVGLLVSPTDPNLLFLHLHVEKSATLVDLYARLKANLDSVGVRTYPFSPPEWVPHLTLASGRWSRHELLELLEGLGPSLP
ncbi:MAG: 2'-5' RNA ligase family protein, partial [Dehalococcoidales bacterium]|nr:2'-5' RNA ligase family protein [Dehalococcoidales bacterium]